MRQALALSRRAVVGLFRQPQFIFPVVLFPLIIAALNTAALNKSTSLPGFPKVDSFLDFVLATTIVQGAQFGSILGATELAIDIESGFFDRLVSSPVSRSAILVGRLAGAATLAAVQACVFMGVMLAFGARIKGGPLGALALVVTAITLSVGIGGLGSALALRTGSSEAVQGAFPAFFVLFFLSSAFFPRALMDGWFKAVATINPLSHIIESMRSLVIDSFSLARAGQAIGIGLALCLFSVTLARLSLRKRLAGAS